MDLRKRLFRRPLTTLVWLLLLIAMTLFILVGGSLYYSFGSMANIVDGLHTTVAVRTDQVLTSTPIENGARWESVPHYLTQENVDFLESLESVEGVYFHSLTGAYSPSFTPVIGLKYDWGGMTDAYWYANESYDDVMLVCEITAIFATESYETYDLTKVGMSGKEEPMGQLYAEAKIVEVLSGNEDYFRSKDEYVNLSLSMLGQEAFAWPQEGKRYIVTGRYTPASEPIYAGGDYHGNGGTLYEEYDHPRLDNPMTSVVSDGSLVCVERMVGSQDDPYTIAHMPLYLPCMTEITGSTEDFLADPDNSVWAEMYESREKGQKSLPVLGTDCLESVYVFLNHDAIMEEGRMFTQEEYDTGAKVCILNQTMAQKAGISVGDTISMSQFLCCDISDTALGENKSVMAGGSQTDGMLNNPTIGEFLPDTEFVTENEEFTVIGLYRLQNEWDDSSYSITPNTVFIPKGAQIEGGFGGAAEEITVTEHDDFQYTRLNDNGAHGVYLSVKIHNGMANDFVTEITGSELAGTFITLDQGYGAIQESINDVTASAWQMFRIAAAGWLLILALYVLLYQGLQRKNIGIMRALGAKPKEARRYLFGSGTVLAAIGVFVGTVISGFILGAVQDKLVATPLTEAVVNSHSSGQAMTQEGLMEMLSQCQFSTVQLLLLGVAQIVIIGLILWIHAALTARQKPRKLLRD